VAGKHVPDWRVLIAVLISPAALSCLVSGQGSFLTATASPGLLACDLPPLTFAAVALLTAAKCEVAGRRLVQLV
jgi:hypothetical protein